jgi:hypothetical protein
VYVSLDYKPRQHPGTNTAVLSERIWSFGFERGFHGTQDVLDGDGGGGPGFDPRISEADPSSDERHSWKHGFVQK